MQPFSLVESSTASHRVTTSIGKGPVGAVLMPQNRLSILGRLGDIVGGEEGDVVTDVLGGDIEKSLVGH